MDAFGPAETGIDRSIGKPLLVIRQFQGESEIHAHPVVFAAGNYSMPTVEPGSRDPLGQPGIWASDLKLSGRVEWVDDGESGIAGRNITVPADLVGAVGSIGKTRYRFEDILQTGQHVIVFQLTNLSTCEYLAYGIGREFVDVRNAWKRYMDRVQAGKMKASPGEVVALARRIAESFPDDESAHFNLGVALMICKTFAEAHACFGKALRSKGNDALNLLYDGAALAAMGAHDAAVERLIEAEEAGTDLTSGSLKAIPQVRDLLERAMQDFIVTHPTRADAGQLWLKYFCPPQQ